MNDLKNELTALIMKISAVTDLFYQQKQAEAYQGMELLIASFESMFVMLNQYQLEKQTTDLGLNRFVAILTEAMQALQQKDTVLLADVLEYELKENLEKIKNSL